jgi:hypothetical protein
MVDAGTANQSREAERHARLIGHTQGAQFLPSKMRELAGREGRPATPNAM